VDRQCHPKAIGCWVAPSFEKLQRLNAPLVCFVTGRESDSCVAYDPETKAVVEVRKTSE
jgi:hypothetical protein